MNITVNTVRQIAHVLKISLSERVRGMIEVAEPAWRIKVR
jgi:hypothetical protein